MPKAKDFTESAVKLCNPPEVKELLEFLSEKQEEAEAVGVEFDKLPGYHKLMEKAKAIGEVIARCQSEIREAVEEYGSYQDTETERCAIKYASKRAVYGNIEAFKKHFPKFVELCIKEAIDVTALKGQVKGKLITDEQLEKTKVLTWDTGYSFYVR